MLHLNYHTGSGLGLLCVGFRVPEGSASAATRHAKANRETICPGEILLFPSSTVLYVPLQTASPLRTFTVMMQKVKTFKEFACSIRKIYICSTRCENAMQRLGVAHFPFIMFSFLF